MSNPTLNGEQTDPQPWQTLSTEQAYRNRWVGVVLDQVQLPTGQQYTYTRLEPAAWASA